MRSNSFKERWKQLEPLIDAALELPIERREAFLDDECGDDSELRQEVGELLANYDGGLTFLDQPASIGFPSLTANANLPPRELVNGLYRIEREIGRGGMATVWLAHDSRHDRKVAVKLIHRHAAPELRSRRFLSEIRTMAGLRHPHILPLYDSGEENGVLFYVMPYVAGETLRQRLQRERQIPASDALRIIREVGSALDAAHRHDVVHRDVKPENILIEEGSAMVADFGIAQALTTNSNDSSLTSRRIAGTPSYMSPEQSRGDLVVDRRADVYSLAVVAGEMLGTDISESAKVVLARGTAVVAQDRYASTIEFSGALDKAFDVGRNRKVWSLYLPVAFTATVVLAFAVFANSFWKVVEQPDVMHALPSSHSQRIRERAVNYAAYDSYLRGLDPGLGRSNEGVKTAIGYFKRAVTIDPKFALAYAELSHMYTIATLGGGFEGLSRNDAIVSARSSAERAIALDDSLSEGHAELAFASLFGSLDMHEAAFELSRAVALDPNGRRPHEYLAHLYEWTERPDDALRETLIAIHADPFSVSSGLMLANALYFDRKYDASLEQLKLFRAVSPPIRLVGSISGSVHVMKGMMPEAIQDYRGLNVDPRDSIPDPLLGRALALAGQRKEALRILKILKTSSEPDAYGIAIIYDGLGDSDDAFVWLRKALDEHSLWVYIMGPMFEKLRSDPRFDEIRRRLNRTAISRQ